MRQPRCWVWSLALIASWSMACGGGSGGVPVEQQAGETDPEQVGGSGGVGDGSEPTLPEVPEPEVPTPPVGAGHGQPCTADGDCLGGHCILDPGFTGGYCTSEDCSANAECGAEGDVCVTDTPGADGNQGEAAETTFCAGSCGTPSDCRNGYDCLPVADGDDSACLPADFFGVPGGAVDGESCRRDEDCRSGACILDEEWPDGYCTTVDCTNFEDCESDGEDNRCLIQESFGGQNFCVRICQENDECRAGYVCQGIGGDLGYCSPDPRQPLDVDPADYPFDIECQPTDGGDLFTFDYEIAEDTVAYMVTPYSPQGDWLYPDRITRPGGGRIDFQRANSFQLAGAQLFGYINPTVVPALEDFAEQLEPGEHTYTLETPADEICHYVLEESTLGTSIDINVYFVDVPGVDADSAPDDEDMQTLLATFDAIYEQAGIQIGTVRYYDIEGDAADEFGVLRSEGQVEELVALSQQPGDTLDENLSANVFFVSAMSFRGGGGAIGISSGLPGPAALHGTGASGVIFTAEFLGTEFGDDRFGNGTVDGSAYTGVVFAHEVGHYLGLFHTSEQYGGFDPIEDTPECTGDSLESCEDLTNLMFPFAGIDHVEMTEGQAWVIQVNPLTKE